MIAVTGGIILVYVMLPLQFTSVTGFITSNQAEDVVNTFESTSSFLRATRGETSFVFLNYTGYNNDGSYNVEMYYSDPHSKEYYGSSQNVIIFPPKSDVNYQNMTNGFAWVVYLDSKGCQSATFVDAKTGQYIGMTEYHCSPS